MGDCSVKNDLKKILLYDAKINSKLEDLARLKALAMKVTTTMGGEGTSGTRNTDKMADAIIKIMEMTEKIDGLVDAYIDLKDYYASMIDTLQNPAQITVLYGHYYSGKSFEKLAEEMGYSRRNVCYIHGAALQALEEIVAKKVDVLP